MRSHDRLCIVSASRDDSIASHGHVLDNDSRACLRSDPDSRLGSAGTTRDLKEVVRLPIGRLVRLAPIDADLHLGRPTLGVDDLRREPVLGHAGLHVDLQGTGDGASDVLPVEADDAL